MEVAYMKVSDLTPDSRNARKHADADIAAICASIRDFGFCDPVAVWGPKNVIVEGHGRVLAAQKLGMTEVPVIRLDNLTDDQRRAYALAHNRTAELSGWDFPELDATLAELEASFDMSLYGFDSAVPADELEELFAPSAPKQQSEEKRVQCPHCGEWFVPQ